MVEDGAKDWPALEKWTDMQYLKRSFGGQSVTINQLDKGSISPNKQHDEKTLTSKRNSFAEFLNKTESSMYGQYMYYLRNEMIVSSALMKDYIKPVFLSKILRTRQIGLTIWAYFYRKPEWKDRERYVCVIEGREEFKLVSPAFKQSIYSGVFDELDPHETPLDFFMGINKKKYPLASQAKIIGATLEPGQCLFVPAYYWVQSQSVTSDVTLLSFEFEPHSELSTILF